MEGVTLTSRQHNLARLNLPYPEAVFDMDFFRRNPEPCTPPSFYTRFSLLTLDPAVYSLAQELYPGKYKPTLTHAFINLLYKKNKLQMCFTQNIDTLERLAGLPEHAVVEAHGSFADQHCIECCARYDGLKLRAQILAGEIAYCYECGGLVKPDIVFFGESVRRPSLPYQYAMPR